MKPVYTQEEWSEREERIEDELRKMRLLLTGYVVRPTMVGSYRCALCGAERDRDIDMTNAHRETCLVKPALPIGTPTPDGNG